MTTFSYLRHAARCNMKWTGLTMERSLRSFFSPHYYLCVYLYGEIPIRLYN
ncbi:hypothetical protein EC836_104106 [Erwinia sp. JUb26]|nr:hypothetical protein EC836_104106 [Erwinia sp. JUb26]